MCPADKRAFSSFAHAQAAITNAVYEHLGEPEIFLFCPTGGVTSNCHEPNEHTAAVSAFHVVLWTQRVGCFWGFLNNELSFSSLVTVLHHSHKLCPCDARLLCCFLHSHRVPVFLLTHCGGGAVAWNRHTVDWWDFTEPVLMCLNSIDVARGLVFQCSPWCVLFRSQSGVPQNLCGVHRGGVLCPEEGTSHLGQYPRKRLWPPKAFPWTLQSKKSLL